MYLLHSLYRADEIYVKYPDAAPPKKWIYSCLRADHWGREGRWVCACVCVCVCVVGAATPSTTLEQQCEIDSWRVRVCWSIMTNRTLIDTARTCLHRFLFWYVLSVCLSIQSIYIYIYTCVFIKPFFNKIQLYINLKAFSFCRGSITLLYFMVQITFSGFRLLKHLDEGHVENINLSTELVERCRIKAYIFSVKTFFWL